MIDIGANLSSTQFDTDLIEVVQRAKNNNVESLILTTTDSNSFFKNLKIIDNIKHIMPVYTTYGLHPHNAKNHNTIFKDIKSHLSNPYVISIGEFGLDYFRMISEQSIQTMVMENFLEHAKDFPHLPLFLHEREAYEDFYKILKNSNTSNKAVVHCFTGNKQQLKAYLDLGCYIGITGWISDNRRNQDVVEALKYLPLDRLMIETDCPYLTPKNYTKKYVRNEPAFLDYIVQSISQILSKPESYIIEKSIQNTLDFFPIKHYNNDNKVNLMRK